MGTCHVHLLHGKLHYQTSLPEARYPLDSWQLTTIDGYAPLESMAEALVPPELF